MIANETVEYGRYMVEFANSFRQQLRSENFSCATENSEIKGLYYMSCAVSQTARFQPVPQDSGYRDGCEPVFSPACVSRDQRMYLLPAR